VSDVPFAQVKAALAEVTELQGTARVAWMAALNERDPALHAEVLSLLAHDDEEVITGVIGDLGGRLADALEPSMPDAIGPYQILDVLGTGGMGVVYRALQTAPLRREVAVKLLRGASFDTLGALRFQAEARSLARLDHPHIASVFDAGIDKTERPYLVLQLVDGVPITEACRELPLRERLAVFLDVCDAVRHAHQRGVVHRDLKPSNLLVAQRDSGPWAMVIDFGIARDEHRADATLTRAGQLLGTPAYMSPEQAGAFGGVVDTRTDVYALGIVLFEIITGSRLFEPGELSLEEIRRRTTTTHLPRPSAVAGADGPVPSRELRGDLDTIVAMALRPEPDRRYSSVEALAEDVRSHLSGRPVSARGDSPVYLAGRFVRRHRGAVALAAVVALGLVGALIVGVVQDARVRTQRDRAIVAERAALDEAEAARQVSAFLVDMFEQADPTHSAGETVTARQILDQGAERIETELVDHPVVRATLLATLGRSYHGIGDYDRAAELVEQALALREAHLDPTAPELHETLELLSIIAHDRGDFPAAIAHSERALALARAAGDDDAIAQYANGLGLSLDSGGRHAEAEALYREALETYRKGHADDDPEVAWMINTLAQSRWRQGHYREAMASWVQAEEIAREGLGTDHQDRAYILNNLAGARLRLGDPGGAEADWREALRILEGVFGPDHAATGRGMANLASALTAQDRHRDALALLDRAIPVLDEAVGDHRLTASALRSRAKVRIAVGDLDGAELDVQAALRIAEALGPTHATTLTAREVRAALLQARGDLAGARAELEAVLALRARSLGDVHPDMALTGLELAKVLRADGDCAAASTETTKALPALQEQLGEDHEVVAEARALLAACR
jgi:tetratricopeptide (TPR) repeat protein